LTDFSFVLLYFTGLTDGRTDGQTKFSSLDRVFIPCSAVKKGQKIDFLQRHFPLITLSLFALKKGQGLL